VAVFAPDSPTPSTLNNVPVGAVQPPTSVAGWTKLVTADLDLVSITTPPYFHHAMALATALEFCALEWRSPEITRQVDALDGLGAPARRLDEVYAALKAS